MRKTLSRQPDLKKNDFDIIKEDDEYKQQQSKKQQNYSPIGNILTKLRAAKFNNPALTDRAKKSRNEKRDKNIGMNLTFTEKHQGGNNPTNTNINYSHIRHTSDPEYIRMFTHTSVKTNKNVNNMSFNQTQNKANNLSLTPRLHTTNKDASLPKKKANVTNVSFKKNDSNTSRKQESVNNETHLQTNYVDTVASHDSSKNSRKNSFIMNPSYLHYFKEKKKKTNNIGGYKHGNHTHVHKGNENEIKSYTGPFDVCCSTNKDPNILREELQKIIINSKITCKPQVGSNYKFKCQKNGIKFEIDIYKLAEMESFYTLKFKKVEGSNLVYREICKKIVLSLHL